MSDQQSAVDQKKVIGAPEDAPKTQSEQERDQAASDFNQETNDAKMATTLHVVVHSPS